MKNVNVFKKAIKADSALKLELAGFGIKLKDDADLMSFVNDVLLNQVRVPSVVNELIVNFMLACANNDIKMSLAAFKDFLVVSGVIKEEKKTKTIVKEVVEVEDEEDEDEDDDE